MVHRRRTTIKSTLIMMLVLFLIVCGWSAFLISSEFSAVQNSFTEMQTKIDEGDYKAAIESEHQLAAHLGSLRREVYATQWHIIGYLPVIGDDVRCAQQLVDIGDELVNSGIDPVITEAEKYVQEKVDVAALLQGNADQLSGIQTSLINARASLKDCSEKVDKLPQAHLAALSDAAQEIRDGVKTAESTVSAVEKVLGLAGVATNIVTNNPSVQGTN